MALGTWKEDPLDNRELQETVGANVTTNVSAADLADIKKEEQLDAVLINQEIEDTQRNEVIYKMPLPKELQKEILSKPKKMSKLQGQSNRLFA